MVSRWIPTPLRIYTCPPTGLSTETPGMAIAGCTPNWDVPFPTWNEKNCTRSSFFASAGSMNGVEIHRRALA